MARRYVSPTGATPAGYDAYYTNLKAAVAAAASNDEIILQMSQQHTFGTTGVQNVASKNLLIRNESNDLNYADCEVRTTDNGTLHVYSSAGNKFAVRGVTFAGTPDALTAYNTSTTNGLIRCEDTACVGQEFEFTGVRFAYMTFENATGSSCGAFYIRPGTSSSKANRFHADTIELDHLYGNRAIDEADIRKTWLLAGVKGIVRNLYAHDCGDLYGRIGGGSVRAHTAGQDTDIDWFNCRWERVYSLGPDGGAGDGGSMYVYTSDDPAVRVTIARFYDCNWSACAAQKGGAIWVGYNARMEVYGGSMEDCWSDPLQRTFGGGASGRGGQVDNAGLGYTLFDGVRFARNHTFSYGGALRNVGANGQMYVRNCEFEDNTADLNAHDIYYQPFSGTSVFTQPIIENSRFLTPGLRVTSFLGNSVGYLGVGPTVRNNYSPSGAGFIADSSAVVTDTTSDATKTGRFIAHRLDRAKRRYFVAPSIGRKELQGL
jgi:hypothetical protein